MTSSGTASPSRAENALDSFTQNALSVLTLSCVLSSSLLLERLTLYDPSGDLKAAGDPYCTSHLTTEDTLREAMSKYGKVKSLCLIRHIVTGASRGYAFVENETEKEMRHAYKAAIDTWMEDTKKMRARKLYLCRGIFYPCYRRILILCAVPTSSFSPPTRSIPRCTGTKEIVGYPDFSVTEGNSEPLRCIVTWKQLMFGFMSGANITDITTQLKQTDDDLLALRDSKGNTQGC
ncbi:hypothetical protein DY000_02021279 [Brassica cretica]|uniref:RRM domain-containing protein n=1 Tax=Brassica cretica TaxID=69181 RepID=A0ABQ7EGW4_BRACR|nr:hypothetical protein DY000_02021279 [Brassica cretica]